MINVYNAEDVLSVKKCGDLFSNNLDSLKKEYRLLVKIWHPDVNSDHSANAVMNYITTLYEHATQLIKEGQWEISNQISFVTDDGKNIKINYQLEKTFELGKYYICPDSIVYVIDYNKKALVDNGTNIMKSFVFADDKMKEEIQKFLPKLTNTYVTNDKKYILIEMSKTNDVLPLSEILKYYDGKIPDKHVAWIISRLNNIACYIQWAGLAHNGICLDTCFISPMYHTIILCGGWWYAKSLGECITATSTDVFNAMPFSVKNKKISSTLTDIECIKALGKKLLGADINKTPKPFLNYLNATKSKNSFENFNEWGTVLLDSYGKRHFIEMKITENEIYAG